MKSARLFVLFLAPRNNPLSSLLLCSVVVAVGRRGERTTNIFRQARVDKFQTTNTRLGAKNGKNRTVAFKGSNFAEK